MIETTTKLGAGGRVVLPSRLREAMGVAVGDELVLILDENGLRILTRKQAIESAQRRVRRYVDKERHLARELIDERRAESRRG